MGEGNRCGVRVGTGKQGQGEDAKGEVGMRGQQWGLRRRWGVVRDRHEKTRGQREGGGHKEMWIEYKAEWKGSGEGVEDRSFIGAVQMKRGAKGSSPS